jgi:hypothetical protein
VKSSSAPSVSTTSEPVVSAHVGRNADLIKEVTRLYAFPGAKILDMTYGKGRFWAKTDLSQYQFAMMDIEPVAQVQGTLRNVPFQDEIFNIVVLDPPYAHNPGTANPHSYAAPNVRYNGHTTASMYNADIMDLYRDGMTEAYRVLSPDGGQVWVKCKDEVEREVQRWSHIKIYEMALDLGFCARDLFVLTGMTAPQRWPGRTQHHARKLHSFLWIFTRPDERYAKLLTKTPPSGLTRAGRVLQ